MKRKPLSTSIQIDRVDLRALGGAAHKLGIGRSALVRIIIKDWIAGGNACAVAAHVSAALDKAAAESCRCKIPGGVDTRGGEV